MGYRAYTRRFVTVIPIAGTREECSVDYNGDARTVTLLLAYMIQLGLRLFGTVRELSSLKFSEVYTELLNSRSYGFAGRKQNSIASLYSSR